MEMFQILDCSPSMETVVKAVKMVLTFIRWAIPVVLIILGSIDMFKAMASGDEKKSQEARKTFIRRLIYAVVAFLIPFIISLAFDLAGQIITTDNDDISKVNEKNDFFTCWDEMNSNGDESDTSGGHKRISGNQE